MIITIHKKYGSINDTHLASKEEVSPVFVRKNSRPNFFPRSISRLNRLILTFVQDCDEDGWKKMPKIKRCIK